MALDVCRPTSSNDASSGLNGCKTIEEQINAKLDLLLQKFEKMEKLQRLQVPPASRILQAPSPYHPSPSLHLDDDLSIHRSDSPGASLSVSPSKREAGNACAGGQRERRPKSAVSLELDPPEKPLQKQRSSQASIPSAALLLPSGSVPSVAAMEEVMVKSLAVNAPWSKPRSRAPSLPEDIDKGHSLVDLEHVIPVPNAQPPQLPPDSSTQGRASASVSVPPPEMRASPQRRTSFLDAPTSPRNRDAVTLVSLQKKSVTQILSDELAAEVEVASPLLDPGSVLLQQMPMCILVLIVCLVALQLGGFVTLSILGIPPRTGAVFMHLGSFLASVTGVRCAYLLKKALSSQTLLAALCKLDQFVFDLKLEWSTASRKEFRVCVAAWILVTALYSGLQGREVWKTGEELPWPKYVALISLAAVEAIVFMMSSALVITTSFIHSNLLLGLDRALDCYCFCVMADMDFDVAVSAWNSLQALLQCIGREFSDSFFTSQASGGLGFAVVLASGMMLAYQTAFDGSLLAQELAMALPVLFFLALNLRVFYHASSLTEKCAHIPAFVNQIPTGSSIDLDRQYLVRFISDSSPGFVVKDLRISRSMFVKLCIFTGGVLSALLGVLSRAY